MRRQHTTWPRPSCASCHWCSATDVRRSAMLRVWGWPGMRTPSRTTPWPARPRCRQWLVATRCASMDVIHAFAFSSPRSPPMASLTINGKSQDIDAPDDMPLRFRSEEHTSELQSLMRISYAVFCLKKKTRQIRTTTQHDKHYY